MTSDATRRALTLSFDNGPVPAVTPRVLDILGERGLVAHFFVLGKLLVDPAGRALVERALREGHLAGNHSYSHETPLGLDPRPDAALLEIEATDALLAPLSPGEKRFRPFGGGGKLGPHLFRDDVVQYLLERSYTCVLWSSVPRDWEDPRGWPERALRDIESREHTVVVLHDIESACLERLPDFLDRVLADGVRVTLDLPADCVPIAGGQLLHDVSPLVTASGAPAARVHS